jgi:hypothetical protein
MFQWHRLSRRHAREDAASAGTEWGGGTSCRRWVRGRSPGSECSARMLDMQCRWPADLTQGAHDGSRR